MELSISILTAFFNLFLGVITLLKNPKSSTNKLLAFLSLVLALYAISNYFSLHAQGPVDTLLWIRIVMFVGAFIGPTIFLLVSTFPTRYIPINKNKIYLIVLYECIVACLGLTPYVFSSITYKVGNIQPHPGYAFPLYMLDFLGFIILAAITLFRKYKKSTGITRVQIKYLLMGIVLTFSLISATNFILVNFFQNSDFVFLGPSWTLIFVGCVSYAIVRHRFLEIKLAIRSAIIYLTVSLVVLALILATNIVTGKIILAELTVSDFFKIILGALSVTLFFPTIYRLSSAMWDKLYFGRSLSHQDSLVTLAQKLPKILDLSALSDLILETLIKTMGLNRAALLILDYEASHYRISKTIGFNESNGISVVKNNFLTQYLDKYPKIIVLEEIEKIAEDTDNKIEKDQWKELIEQMIHIEAAVIIPVVSVNKIISLIVLGNKKGGDAYSVEDLKLLDVISSQAAIAIENARLYKEISELNHNLQDKVNSVTAQLQKRNYDLEKANDDLKSLDKMKDQLIAITSHELRTPASNVQNYLWMTLKHPDPKTILSPADQERLQRSLNSVQNLIRLINDILDASKIEGGKLEISLQPVNYDDLIRNVLEDFVLKARQKGLVLRIAKSADLPPSVIADPLRLKEILTNLVSNAIKYTDHGNILVHTGQENGRIIITVKDTGRGIKKEHMTYLFNKFYREDTTLSSSNPETGGTGLGLYITKSLVNLMHGEIRVQSDIGAGSTFQIILPASNEKSKEDVSVKKAFRDIFTENDFKQIKSDKLDLVQQPYIEPSLVLDRHEGRKRILIIEDEEEMRKFYIEYLSALYDVMGAADGEDGISKMILHRYDLVLLDVMMPRLDGIGFLRKKQTIQAISSIPVILLTNLGEEESLAKCFELGAKAMIMKSDVTPDQIPRIIEKVLSDSQKSSEASHHVYS